jgi:Sulfotransferase family
MPLTAANLHFAQGFRSPARLWRNVRCLITNRLTWPEADYLVNHDRKLIYCPIAKVACSSIKQWFLAELGESVPELASIHKAAERHRLREQSALLALQVLRDRDYFKFAFVRNPWARLVSAYLNKFLRSNSCSTRIAREMGRLPRLEPHPSSLVDITFEQFVRHLATGNPARFDVHWRPQHLYLTGHDFDFLGRFEHLTDDFAPLQKRLGTSTPLPRCKTTGYGLAQERMEVVAGQTPAELLQRGALPDYRWFYTPELRDIVRQIYAADIQICGYEFLPAA